MVDVACMAMSSWPHAQAWPHAQWVTATVEYSMWYESDYHITIFVLRMHHLYVQSHVSGCRPSVPRLVKPHAAVRTIKLI